MAAKRLTDTGKRNAQATQRRLALLIEERIARTGELAQARYDGVARGPAA
jgi:hypothetical protein